MNGTANPTPELPVADIQALVAAGFKDLPHGEYLLLTIGDGRAADAKAWLAQLLAAQPELVVSVETVAQRLGGRRQRLVTVAVSHEGLLALGLRPSASRPFPSTFVDGMGQADRARLLGDDDAASWRWADCAVSEDAAKQGAQRQVVHLLVAHYWADARHGHVCPLLSGHTLAAAGMRVERVCADRRGFDAQGNTIEPFRFMDGISQPQVAGLRADLERDYRDAEGAKRLAAERDRIAAGEFLLGQGNEYGELSYAPSVEGYPGDTAFAAAGSYVAVRQIRQDVVAFEEFEATYPAGPDGVLITERLIGRRRDGTPLCPFNADDLRKNDFAYFTTDLEGYGCPRGAHMRRANPRDSLGHDPVDGEKSARLHRLLRRGRSYRQEGGNDGKDERGLFFMALNADLDRQFALIQQRWIANPGFDGLADEGDPLLGQSQRAFTIQGPLLSERVTGLPRFTEVVGGGYFLLPSLPALYFMAQPLAAPI